MELRISKTLYDREAILTAAYSLSGVCNIRIQEENDENIEISLEPMGKEVDFEHQLWNELVDQQLRINLENRFGKIRELIVKHAFAPLDNLKTEVENIVGRD